MAISRRSGSRGRHLRVCTVIQVAAQLRKFGQRSRYGPYKPVVLVHDVSGGSIIHQYFSPSSVYVGSTERTELIVDKYDDDKEKKVG